MDEILASIRRIIADDDGAGDILPDDAQRLTDSSRPAEAARPVATPQPQSWQDRSIAAPRPIPEARTADVSRAAERPAAQPRPAAHQPPARPKPLLAPETDAAVAGAFDSLGALLVPAHQRSVEDLMKEMLRPMLKSWLDENLPQVVEGLVRQEIERITRRGR